MLPATLYTDLLILRETVLFSGESQCFPRENQGKQRDSRKNKTVSQWTSY